jgi:hypothetical protein
MIFTKIDWNWAADSGEVFKKLFSQFLLFFGYYLSLCKEVVIAKKWFVPTLVKIGPVVLEKKSKM